VPRIVRFMVGTFTLIREKRSNKKDCTRRAPALQLAGPSLTLPARDKTGRYLIAFPSGILPHAREDATCVGTSVLSYRARNPGNLGPGRPCRSSTEAAQHRPLAHRRSACGLPELRRPSAPED